MIILWVTRILAVPFPNSGIGIAFASVGPTSLALGLVACACAGICFEDATLEDGGTGIGGTTRISGVTALNGTIATGNILRVSTGFAGWVRFASKHPFKAGIGANKPSKDWRWRDSRCNEEEESIGELHFVGCL